jgi:chemotaxis signal transduction protein
MEQAAEYILPNDSRKSMHILFSSCGSVFALDYGHVCEIIPCMDTVLVNGAPEYVRGLINYGGEICPVISLCALPDKAAEYIRAKSCFIMIKTSKTRKAAIGILADSFLGSFSFSKTEVKHLDRGIFPGPDGPVSSTVACPQGTAGILEPGTFFKWMDWLDI